MQRATSSPLWNSVEPSETTSSNVRASLRLDQPRVNRRRPKSSSYTLSDTRTGGPIRTGVTVSHQKTLLGAVFQYGIQLVARVPRSDRQRNEEKADGHGPWPRRAQASATEIIGGRQDVRKGESRFRCGAVGWRDGRTPTRAPPSLARKTPSADCALRARKAWRQDASSSESLAPFSLRHGIQRLRRKQPTATTHPYTAIDAASRIRLDTLIRLYPFKCFRVFSTLKGLARRKLFAPADLADTSLLEPGFYFSFYFRDPPKTVTF